MISSPFTGKLTAIRPGAVVVNLCTVAIPKTRRVVGIAICKWQRATDDVKNTLSVGTAFALVSCANHYR